MYLKSQGQLNLRYNDAATDYTLRLNTNGLIEIVGVTDYETLVTDDDDIPNKKYVDDLLGVPTQIVQGDSAVSVVDDGTAAGYVEIVADSEQVAYFDAQAATIRLGKASGAGRVELNDSEVSLNVGGVEYINLSAGTQTIGVSGDSYFFISESSNIIYGYAGGTGYFYLSHSTENAVLGNLSKTNIELNSSTQTAKIEATNTDVFNATSNAQRLGVSGDTNIQLNQSGNTMQFYRANTKVFEAIAGGLLIGSGAIGCNIFYSGDDFFISNDILDGLLTIRGTNTSDVTSNLIIGDPNTSVDIYYNGTKMFATKSDGAIVFDQFSAPSLEFRDGADNEISRIFNTSGEAYFQRYNGSGWDGGVKINSNSGTELYHGNVQILATDSTGATVTGDLRADFFIGDGSQLTNLPSGGGLFSEDADDNIIGGTGAGANLTGSSGINNFLGGVNAGNAMTSGDSCIVIGNDASLFNQTGDDNVVIGYQAARGTSGNSHQRDVIIGQKAGYSVTTGQQNVFIGSEADYYVTDGLGNVAVGYQVMQYNISGDDNVAIGRQALRGTFSSANPMNNVALGNRAGYKVTSGNQNVLIGRGTGGEITTGNNNIAIGDTAVDQCQTGAGNIGIGNFALRLCTDSNMIGIGTTALDDMVSASDGFIAIGYQAAKEWNGSVGGNVCIGEFAGSGNPLTGADYDHSVIIGHEAANLLEASGECVLIGFDVASTMQDGSQNTLIGTLCNVDDSTSQNRIALGYNITVDVDNKAVIGNSSVTTIGGYTTWSNYSDRSVKRNIIDSDLGLDFICRLQPREFEREDHGDLVYTGMIAQEVKEVLDDLNIEFSGWIAPGGNGLQMLSYETFVMPLINSVK